MKIFTVIKTIDKKKNGFYPNGGYSSIHDNGRGWIQRELYIKDNDGNTVKIDNDQIGELYDYLKPLPK